MLKAILAGLLALGSAVPVVADEIPENFRFSVKLPEGTPDLKNLEFTWGEAEICPNPDYDTELPKDPVQAMIGHSHICFENESGEPLIKVQYAFYAHPVRRALYFLVRWKLIFAEGLFLEGLYWNPERDAGRYFGYRVDDGSLFEVVAADHAFVNYQNTVLWLFGIHRILSVGEQR